MKEQAGIALSLESVDGYAVGQWFWACERCNEKSGPCDTKWAAEELAFLHTKSDKHKENTR